MKSGNLAPIDTYSNDWNTALGKGTIACWNSGAWGTFISGSMPDYKGKMKATDAAVDGRQGQRQLWWLNHRRDKPAHAKERRVCPVAEHRPKPAGIHQSCQSGPVPVTQSTLSNRLVMSLRLLERGGFTR
jgi:hypothetical protein